MKRIWFFLSLPTIVFVLFLFVVPVCAGFEGYWISESISGDSVVMDNGGQAAKTDQIVFFKSGKMRIHVKDKPEIMIIRPDLGLLWRIDKKNASYKEIMFKDIKAGVDAVKSALESGAMQKNRDALELKMVPAGKSETVLGEEGEVVELRVAGKTVMTLWLAKKYDLGYEYYQRYETLGMFPGVSCEALKGLRGMPLKSITNLGNGKGEQTVISIITKIVETEISDKKFELPDGLVKKN